MTAAMPVASPLVRPKERGILFSAPMVRAILAGRKTVTRRVVKHRHPISFLGGQHEKDDPACWGYFFDGPERHGYAVLARGLDERENHGRVSIPCPYGKAGERLWVRETFALSIRDPESFDRDMKDPSNWDGAVYRATDENSGEWEHYDEDGNRTKIPAPWKPAIHMPRWASRITLEVVDVRVERLHAITEDDARAEGVERFRLYESGDDLGDEMNGHGYAPPLCSYLGAFETLWDEINGKDAWAANPWVWRIAFRPTFRDDRR